MLDCRSGALVILVLLTPVGRAVDLPGSALAPTPPMGWNSWNCVGHGVSEELICGIADAMVASGMREAGYQYVVIDDMWHVGRVDPWHADSQGNMVPGGPDVPGRDADGDLLADPAKFPHGIAAVADHVHACGLKFGLYTVPGPRTCAGCTGSGDYEAHDLRTFADWGVDFIKLDGCSYVTGLRETMQRWRDLLDGLERPIVLSVNVGVPDWIGQYADMWRTTTDIMAVWSYAPGEFCLMASISDIIDLQLGLEEQHGRGGWNDPDMLQVGNGKLTETENEAHFGMWCMLGAPLIAGNDLRTMSESTRRILTNRELIAVDQDPLGHRGQKVRDLGAGRSVWAKRLADPTRLAVALLNAGEADGPLTVDLADLGVRGPVALRDLCRHVELGTFERSYTATVPAHGVVIVRLTAYERIGPFAQVEPIPATGRAFELEDPVHYFGGATVLSEQPGYSGSGYVLGRNHAWRPLDVVWIVSAPAGAYRLRLRYALGTETPFRCRVDVRGDWAGELELPPTGSWSAWREFDIAAPITLQQGYNQVRLASPDSARNAIALDSLIVTPAAALP